MESCLRAAGKQATNRSLGGANLIPVAVGWDMTEVMPVSGSYTGPTDALRRMSVEVRVEPSALSEPGR
jgi:hypothetical protein